MCLQYIEFLVIDHHQKTKRLTRGLKNAHPKTFQGVFRVQNPQETPKKAPGIPKMPRKIRSLCPPREV